MRGKKIAVLAAVVVLAAIWAAALSMPGLRKPDSVSSATMAPPAIAGILPAEGQVATQVRITGTVFGNAQGTSVVSFNGVPAAVYSSWTATEVVCAVPAGATTGPVTLTTAGGTSNGVQFTVMPEVAPPPPSGVPTSTWYLAEGTTSWGFDTRIDIENPNTQSVSARITYMTTEGPVVMPNMVLPALSQTAVYPGDALGRKDFSTKVECLDGKTIAVDRTMTWTGQGAPSSESHASVGVTSPATTWYLPEGSANWGFECWLLIQNPGAVAANCEVTYMIEGEGPKAVYHQVPAGSRATFSMGDDIGNEDASIKVSSDVPVIPERAMYRNNRRGGHDSIGTTSPALDYYLAEGTTNWGFTTYVLVQNPNATPTSVDITFMTSDFGPRAMEQFTMPANSRKTIRVNDVLPGLDLSTHVRGSQPIIAERAMYWDNGKGEACHDSIGMAEPHAAFYLPGGEVDSGWETWTLVQNPNSVPVSVEVFYLTSTGQGNVFFSDTIAANSRRTYNMSDRLPSGKASIMVVSTTAGQKIMCERAMYWNARSSGTDTIGGFSD